MGTRLASVRRNVKPHFINAHRDHSQKVQSSSEPLTLLLPTFGSRNGRVAVEEWLAFFVWLCTTGGSCSAVRFMASFISFSTGYPMFCDHQVMYARLSLEDIERHSVTQDSMSSWRGSDGQEPRIKTCAMFPAFRNPPQLFYVQIQALRN